MIDMIQEMVDDILDVEGDIRIGNLTFSRSAILKEMDPIAYRELCTDMADSLIEDLRGELESLDVVDDFDEVEDLVTRIKQLEGI
jgi:hypothetical protein